MDDVPFRWAVIHGLVRDQQGRKMSKSLGNVIDPMEMIDRYGADALRFSLARAATGGQQDIPLSEEAIEAGRNFANKLWNAARLVLRAYPGGEPALPPAERRTLAERWLLVSTPTCITEVDTALDEFRFADAAQTLYRFVWSEFCDWGLEFEKGRLDGGGTEGEDATQLLAWLLERTLRLLHPIMPFVTEEIWQRVGMAEPEALAIASWPQGEAGLLDPEAEAALTQMQAIVTAVRQFRSKHGISPKERFDALAGVPADTLEAVTGQADAALRLAGVTSWRSLRPMPPPGKGGPPSPSRKVSSNSRPGCSTRRPSVLASPSSVTAFSPIWNGPRRSSRTRASRRRLPPRWSSRNARSGSGSVPSWSPSMRSSPSSAKAPEVPDP